MKVAFTTQDMKRVDAHFGWAKNVAIYEISPDGRRFVEVVQFDGDRNEDGNEDKLVAKIEAIRDCAIVYVSAIGGAAAARVVAAKIHPLKVPEETEISGLLDRLQLVLQGTPPPWLRKALEKGKDRTFDFDDEEGADHA